MLLISPEGKYPSYYGEIQDSNPEWNLGDALPAGWIQVSEATPPELSENQVLVPEQPAEIDGVMTQQWSVRDLTENEIAEKNAPLTAKQKLIDLGLTEAEIKALAIGLAF